MFVSILVLLELPREQPGHSVNPNDRLHVSILVLLELPRELPSTAPEVEKPRVSILVLLELPRELRKHIYIL